jgi:small subunit ribosomal protein S6
MPANVYECLVILDTNKMAGDQVAVTKQLHTTLEKHSAEILASRPWGDQKLAYPMGNHKKGLYYLLYFRSEGKHLVEIERDFRLNETIIRNMILKIDPKLVDVMLTMARDERAQALQTVNTPPPEEDLGMASDMNERGPRRNPRSGGRRGESAGDDKPGT